MKYTKQQRLDIGKKIYTRELNVAQAAEIYEVNIYTARDYMRLFRDINNLPPLDSDSEIQNSSIKSKHSTLDELGQLSKQELIAEVIKARIEAERAKKICGVDKEKCQAIPREILFEYLFELSEEIKTILSFYKTHFSFNGVFKEMILCGGGSNLIGLDVYLSDQFDIKVKKEIPWIFKEQCFNHKKKTLKLLIGDFFFQPLFSKQIKSCPFSEDKFASHATVLGLALRGIMNAEE